MVSVPNVSERLAHGYAYWHACALIYEILVARDIKIQPSIGHFVTNGQMGHRLASTILDNSVHELRLEDWYPRAEYVLPGTPVEHLVREYRQFPMELFQWNRMSRKTYHLPHSLVAALSSATFNEISWRDITWPHDAFIITLERPFVVEYDGGGRELFDTVLVSQVPMVPGGPKRLTIRLMQAPKHPGVELGFSGQQMEHYRGLVRRGAWSKAWDLCEEVRMRMVAEYPTIPGACGATLDVDLESDEPVRLEYDDLNQIYADGVQLEQSDLDTTRRQRSEAMIVALRIAVGWALYRETMSPDRIATVKHRHGSRQLSGGRSGVITNPEEVHHILGKSDLGRASSGAGSRRTLEEGGYKRPHWRGPHKRRRQGAPPDAPRTVRIPAVLVREDLVPLFGIIGGTQTVVFFEE